jgi:hypothetical protein
MPVGSSADTRDRPLDRAIEIEDDVARMCIADHASQPEERGDARAEAATREQSRGAMVREPELRLDSAKRSYEDCSATTSVHTSLRISLLN